MNTTPALRGNARRAARPHVVVVEPRRVEVEEPPSAEALRGALEDAAEVAPRPAATQATLAIFSRGALIDARSFSF